VNYFTSSENADSFRGEPVLLDVIPVLTTTLDMSLEEVCLRGLNWIICKCSDRIYAFEPTTHTLVEASDSSSLMSELKQVSPLPVYIDDPYLQGAVSSIEYFATSACNLSCSYCYLGPLPDKLTPRERDIGPARRTLENLFDDLRVGPRLSLLFIGGEPLIAFDVIKELTECVTALCIQHSVELEVKITSNGTVMNERIADWIATHNVSFTVSTDGRFQTYNRPLKQLGESNPLQKLGRFLDLRKVQVRCTLRPEQFLKQKDVFGDLLSYTPHAIYIEPVRALPVTSADLHNYVQGLSELYELCQRLGVWEGQLDAAFAAVQRGQVSRSHCGAGASHLVLRSDGSISGCANLSTPEQRSKLQPYHYDVDADSTCGRCGIRYVCQAIGGACRAWRIMKDHPEPDLMDCCCSAARIFLAFKRLSRTECRAL